MAARPRLLRIPLYLALALATLWTHTFAAEPRARPGGKGYHREHLSFPFRWKANRLKPGVALDQTILIDPFDAPGKKNIRFDEFRIILGYGSLSVFDALGTDEVAGLKRQDAEEKIRKLQAIGETERNGSFIAGLVNVHEGKMFMFFNLTRLAHSDPFAFRLLSHEPLHLARLLITTEEKPCVDYLRDSYTNLNDENEEYFAETLERLTTIAIDRYFKILSRNPSLH
jgi:hypothetical protein